MDYAQSERRDGHRVTPLVDGDAVFASIRRDLQMARWRIYIATWGLEDAFLIEQGPGGERRLSDLIREALAAHPGLEIYMLVWDWEMFEMPLVAGIWWPGAAGIAPQMPPVPTAEKFANPADRARLHVALEGNPIAGSHHQKFVLCDLTGEGDPAQPTASLHCLGMNLQNHCWDRPDHPYPKVYRGNPTLWHDTGARVQGPVIADFEREFIRRWRDATGEDLPPNQFANPPCGQTRVTALLHRERAERPSLVKDWYLEAIRQAREFVYLENQYFDDADVAAALYETYLERERAGQPIAAALVLPWWEDLRSTQWPPWHPIAPWTRFNVARLRVRTATSFKPRGIDTPYVRPVGGWPEVREPPDPDEMLRLMNPATPSSATSLVDLQRRFAVKVGEGWVEWRDIEWVRGGIEVYRMTATTGRWPPHPVYVHSKLAIVDDRYTVGSSNSSYQSFVQDSEANLAVDGRGDVDDLLSRLWPPMLGRFAPLGAPPREWIAAFAHVATQDQANADLARRGKRAAPPRGMLLPWQPYDY